MENQTRERNLNNEKINKKNEKIIKEILLEREKEMLLKKEKERELEREKEMLLEREAEKRIEQEIAEEIKEEKYHMEIEQLKETNSKN